ncbi:hypothetical protein MKW98_012442 [Papaver atlanticum]|uniref:Uncharacterized protein n=1 Tax=Papaver atlanticum TaxID=357466 RepID=A0AAD4X6E1_9MAGN|nr:hypothetical protein MKW98_012442 [Papaver atlanticum]
MSSSSSSSEDQRGRGRQFERGETSISSASASVGRTRLRRGRQRLSGNSRDEVWPEPFIEALAYQVAVNAASSASPTSVTLRRLSAAPAISTLFQVCSAWRAISHSNLLWHNLTNRIWGGDSLVHNTWREEYIYRHCTAYNFRISRSLYSTLNYDPNIDNSGPLACRCLTLSDSHLACGFDDGSVRLFNLISRLHVSTFHPHHRDRLGRFSRAVTGIVLTDTRVIFASLDGDIHVAVIGLVGTRRAQLGDMVNDGTLVDFNGCNRWWLGLYAGAPGRSFHIWNGETEELVFVGGTLTDPESVMGWHSLSDELTEPLGRVRFTSTVENDVAVACTGIRLMAFDLTNLGSVLNDEQFQRVGLIVSSVDVSNRLLMVVDNRRIASVRRVDNFEEVCAFTVDDVGGARRGGLIGCMNGGCVFICLGGNIRVWDALYGEYVSSFRERLEGEVNELIANERHVAAACSSDMTIHLWDYSAP